MTRKIAAKLAIASVVLISSIAGANAYTIHNSNGKNWVTCEDGTNWTFNGGTTQITHQHAARFCAKLGSSLTVQPAGSPSAPVEAKSSRIK